MDDTFAAFDDRLLELAGFVEGAESLERGLARLSELVGHAMACDHCSIMLVKQDPDSGEPRLRVQAHYGELPQPAYDVKQPLGSGIAGRAASSQKGLLVNDLHASELAAEARRSRDAEPVDVIAVPVLLEGELLGVINMDSPRGRRFVEEDLRMASILTLVVAKSVLIHRLKGLLQTSFTQMAVARQAEHRHGRITHAPEEVARLLARTLYDEMSQAGLSRDHVLVAATELIGRVSETGE